MRVRKKFLNPLAMSAAMVAALSSFTVFGADPSDELTFYRERQDKASPSSVLKWLREGNERFARGKALHGGYSGDARQRRIIAAQGQRALAVVLSCIDSRTTPEVIFDTTVGDLFTARVGANVINKDILGSLEISAASGAKVVVILGHSDCGGVKGACRNIEFGHMTQLLKRVRPAVLETNTKLDHDPALSHRVGERVADNPLYIAEVGHTHAQRSARQVYQQSPILAQMVNKGEIILVAAIYDVQSGLVHFDKIIK